MFNFIGWMVIGAAFGFWRAWKKTSASYARAMRIVTETPTNNRINQAQTMGQIRGTRVVPLVIYTIGGGLVGALIYFAASGLVAVL